MDADARLSRMGPCAPGSLCPACAFVRADVHACVSGKKDARSLFHEDVERSDRWRAVMTRERKRETQVNIIKRSSGVNPRMKHAK